MSQLADFFDKRTRGTLAKAGITTVTDLLRYFPRRYLEPGELTTFDSLPIGEHVIVQATVDSVATRSMRNRRGTITDVTITDGWSHMAVSFFNQRWLAAYLKPGMVVVFAGKAAEYRGRPTLNSPTWLNRDEHETNWTEEDLNSPLPIYRQTARINTTRFWKAIKVLLDIAPAELSADPVPDELLAKHGLPRLHDALNYTHRPKNMEHVRHATRRWKYEEALALQTAISMRRADFAELSATPLVGRGQRSERFDENFPYPFTSAQLRAGEDITADLAKPRPMHRLLHGDVGSGKTVVALRAMLAAVDSSVQAALLAPTEVLATQHFRSITALLGEQAAFTRIPHPDEVRVALLTGSLPAAERRQLALDIAAGSVDIVVGTHALLSDSTMFADLGLVVVDEQHRFGVEQREALRAKGGTTVPHTLIMSATPIPRTVAMTVFADLSISTLDELPTGPKNIDTFAVSLRQHSHWLGRVHDIAAEAIAAGQRVFVVTGRIETSEEEDPDTGTSKVLLGVDDVAEKLAALPQFAGVDIGVMHGKLPTADKDAVMQAFASGEIQLLVSTTVIEVGIDIPDATVMIIHDADRFGVAQLHQLRGRVGRDGRPAKCFLITQVAEHSPGFVRLHEVAQTLDGFRLAEFDLSQRGEGDVIGRAQWGGSSLRHLSILADSDIISSARNDAAELIAADPHLAHHPALRELISQVLPADSAHLIEAS